MNKKVYLFVMQMILGFIFMNLAKPVYSAEEFSPGNYYLQGVMEVGSIITLHKDGRFDYFLSVGSYDEFAKGNWTYKNNVLTLNSDALDAPPKFTLKSSTRKNDGNITVLVLNKKGQGLKSIDVNLYFKDSDEPEQGYTQTDGYVFPSDKFPQTIGLFIESYNIAEKLFDVKDQTNNYFVFEFEPGNIGQKQFINTEFKFNNNVLTMIVEDGTELNYFKH